MVDFNTPQSKAVKRLADAYISLDIKNVERLLSKNYQHEPLLESTDFPIQKKESHLQTWESICSSVNKHEVRIRHRRTAFKLRLISTTQVIFREFVEALGKLSSTFVPLYRTVTSSQTITHDCDAGHTHVLYCLWGHA